MAVAEVPPSLPSRVLHPESLPNPHFTFSGYLSRALPPLGAPSKFDRPICADFRQNESCPRGLACPDRHLLPPSERSGTKNLICKHYQRGLCKKSELCEFAHTFNLRDERECKDYSRYGICSAGDDCTYLHIHPTSDLRRPACPHYARGFCPLGSLCSMRHIKHPRLCPFYIAGLCPNGRAHPPDVDKVVSCEYGAHPKWVKDEDIHPRRPELRKVKDPEQEAREQEAREQEFREEEAKAFENNFSGGMDGGRGRGGFGRRGRGRGRGRRY